MDTLIQLAILLILAVFCYSLIYKLNSRETIALHRRPENIRRKPWECVDYRALNIPEPGGW